MRTKRLSDFYTLLPMRLSGNWHWPDWMRRGLQMSAATIISGPQRQIFVPGVAYRSETSIHRTNTRRGTAGCGPYGRQSHHGRALAGRKHTTTWLCGKRDKQWPRCRPRARCRTSDGWDCAGPRRLLQALSQRRRQNLARSYWRIFSVARTGIHAGFVENESKLAARRRSSDISVRSRNHRSVSLSRHKQLLARSATALANYTERAPHPFTAPS